MAQSTRIIQTFDQLKALQGRHTAVYSGSFNPPHLGHLHLMECVIQHKVEQVLIFPHSLNWRKTDQLLPLEIRIEMLLLLLLDSEHAQKLYICDPILFHGLRENIQDVSDALGGKSFVHVLVGGDRPSIQFAQKFKGYNHLVVQRGEDVDAVCRCVFQDHYQVFHDQHEASSSKVRNGDDMTRQRMLGERLYHYIEDNGYWGQLNLPREP